MLGPMVRRRSHRPFRPSATGEWLDRHELVAMMACSAAVYYAPVAITAARDAWAGVYGVAAAAAVAIPALLGVGALAYATSLPERRFPGVFDIVGSSHQVMHVMVALAHFVEFAFVLDALTQRRTSR
jgi:predicted membrane channel-forming protein YqfA (hemolysin III family)